MKAGKAILIGLALLLTPLFHLEAQIPGTLSYQAFLSDSLGVPKADGTYTLTFRLYDAGTGGTALWTETKDLDVKQGLFYTHLGDQTPFPASLRFDRPYWLGIQVGSEAELSPRVALSSVGYSFTAFRADSAQFAMRADTARYVINAPSPTGPAGGDLSGTYPDPTIAAGAVTMDKIDTSGVLSGQAIMFNGENVRWQTPPNPGGTITGVTAGAGLTGGGTSGDVTLSIDFADNGSDVTASRSDHVHGGEGIASGTVAESFIDPAIARDNEIMATVLAADGLGSGLHADSLDGLDASDFAAAAHYHAGEDITSGTVAVDSLATSGGASVGGSLTITGGQVVNVDSVITQTYTTTTSDRIILCSLDPQYEFLEVTLHSAASAPGQLLSIKTKNIYVDILPSGEETIDGMNSIGLDTYNVSGVTLVSDGENWWIISTAILLAR